MQRSRTDNLILLAFGVVVLVSIFAVLTYFGDDSGTEKIKAGYIMPGSKDDSGWNSLHYQAVKKACDEQNIELIMKDNAEEFSGKCEIALRALADEGAQLIFLSSYGYSEEVKDVVGEYPNITFFANSSEYHDKNMTSYFARIYQARYLSGIIAGMHTKNGRIGYTAAMPNNEVNRGISAFALGVRKVNPRAKVIVAWTGAWDDEEKEREATKNLINNSQVDVITYHQNQTYVVDEAEKAGIASIGYHAPLEGASDNHLTAVVCDWNPIYKQLIQEFLRGKAKEQNYWIGIENDAVGLSEYSGAVTQDERNEVEKAKNEILSGHAVFSGEIYDNKGQLKCGKNETISDEEILEHFDWYAEGVEFYGE